MSAHAARDGLLKWVGAVEKKPHKVFVVHGEPEVCDIFTETLRSLGYHAYAPRFTAVYDALADTFVFEGLKRADTGRAESVPGERRKKSSRLVRGPVFRAGGGRSTAEGT
jgi:metallo-beta-lactamase family protein